MNLLRRPVRQQVTGGGWQYAYVEEFIKGFATVRLGSPRGTRLTMLPVITKRVAPGERVIVSYSADGQPYVRPLTAMPEIPELPDGSGVGEQIEEQGIIAAKFGRDSAQPGIAWEQIGPIGYSTHMTSLELNYTYWETTPGLVKPYTAGRYGAYYDYGYKFFAPEDGKYFCRFCVAFKYLASTDIPDRYTGDDMIDLFFGTAMRRVRFCARRIDDGVDLITISGNAVIQANATPYTFEEGGTFTERIGEPGMDNEWTGVPQFWYDELPNPRIGLDFEYAYREGCYPVVEVWKIAQASQTLKGQAGWFYTDAAYETPYAWLE